MTVVRCGGCGKRFEGIDEFEAIAIVLIHLKSTPDDAHANELKWIAGELLKDRRETPRLQMEVTS